jgi:hypothetical protein
MFYHEKESWVFSSYVVIYQIPRLPFPEEFSDWMKLAPNITIRIDTFTIRRANNTV